eukprot:13396945-Ditylum_brightwellii.AAC.1
MQLHAEEDYWKEGRVGAIEYPNFKAWMTHTCFKFIKKSVRLSDYSILAVDKAQDRLWKARDSIVAVRNHCKQFIPRCWGDATIGEARIPCNCRALCIQPKCSQLSTSSMGSDRREDDENSERTLVP